MERFLEIFEEYSDDFKYREDLPLANWPTVIGAIVIYLLVVGIGRKVMEKNPQWTFSLKRVVLLHNAFLCFWSVCMLLGILYNLFFIWRDEPALSKRNAVSKTDRFLCDPGCILAIGKHSWWFYLFFISKFYELLDTVIIILKRRPLIFLHVYHHIITLVLTYVMLQHGCGIQWIATTANCAVHVPMYFYYACSTFGYSPWWKKYLTTFQIVQFVIDLTANSVGLWIYTQNRSDCCGNIYAWLFGQFVLLSFLILFINFYRKTYVAESGRRASGRPTKKEE
eukprot:TRINITY_DN2806_c0_g1_i1.p1 TRINITY_DN2806_c0_g1~~TRINITY_DN2806_c0_g1_i1.p1  ORF type:complete len:281 (+),score=89.10 TRINITY_DN2806_c0_g1_i1:90-932(+)